LSPGNAGLVFSLTRRGIAAGIATGVVVTAWFQGLCPLGKASSFSTDFRHFPFDHQADGRITGVLRHQPVTIWA
jgi:hypothetical protein